MENLKNLRLQKRYSQLGLGMKIGVTQESISAYESGRADPSIDVIKSLSDLFNCSIDYLLDLTDIKTKAKDIILYNNLSHDEHCLLDAFRKLKSNDKHKILGYLDSLTKNT